MQELHFYGILTVRKWFLSVVALVDKFLGGFFNVLTTNTTNSIKDALNDVVDIAKQCVSNITFTGAASDASTEQQCQYYADLINEFPCAIECLFVRYAKFFVNVVGDAFRGSELLDHSGACEADVLLSRLIDEALENTESFPPHFTPAFDSIRGTLSAADAALHGPSCQMDPRSNKLNKQRDLLWHNTTRPGQQYSTMLHTDKTPFGAPRGRNTAYKLFDDEEGKYICAFNEAFGNVGFMNSLCDAVVRSLYKFIISRPP